MENDRDRIAQPQWQRQIEANVVPLSIEKIPINKAVGRIPAKGVLSSSPLPRFSESLRDGFLLYRADVEAAQQRGLIIQGEIAAGMREFPTLKQGETCRIFTGGRVEEPASYRVIPFEWCQEKNGRVWLQRYSENDYILQEGIEISCGEQIVEAGFPLCPTDIARMAAVEIADISVYCQPRIAICCTGSELVRHVRYPGEKVSVNEFILHEGLLHFASKISTALIQDKQHLLHDHLAGCSKEYDLLVTSGGTGKGAYDFLQETTHTLDAEIIFEKLPFRPGNSTLARLPDGTLLLALPGPPRAVATLLDELVLPVVWLLQGNVHPWSRSFMAELLTSANKCFPESQIKSGLLEFNNGCVGVRPCEAIEKWRNRQNMHCRIVYPVGRKVLAGELVEVHL